MSPHAGVEGADLEHHEIEGSRAFANRLRTLGGEPGVAAEEHGVIAVRTDDERRPQRRIAVLEAATGKVLRRARRSRQTSAARQRVRLPPVELDDALGLTPHASRCAPTPSDVTNGTSSCASSRMVG